MALPADLQLDSTIIELFQMKLSSLFTEHLLTNGFGKGEEQKLILNFLNLSMLKALINHQNRSTVLVGRLAAPNRMAPSNHAALAFQNATSPMCT